MSDIDIKPYQTAAVDKNSVDNNLINKPQTTIKRPAARLCFLLLIIFSVIIVLSGSFLLMYRLPSPLFCRDYSTLILDQDGKILRVFLNEREQWVFPPGEDSVPLKLALAVINYEDKRFYSHYGIDLLSLGRAVIQNIRAGRIVSGASTITMQVARLSQPKARTIKNKLIEMFQALKIEFSYSKDEILKLYLTHAPYGGNIVGYKAASYRYFGKPPEELSWGDAATLAVLPNSPGLINPVNDSKRLKGKRDSLLKRLYERGVITEETYNLAIGEQIPEKQIPFNLAAPHLTETLRYNIDKNIIKTTISSRIQKRINGIVSDYMGEISQRGINNCAVLVVNTKNGAVRACIGSNDYFDNQNGGKINGVLTARSTGSILKPFLYGLAMDEGLIIPESKLEDVPVTYGAYTPYNYDGSFRGLVTASDALICSLNAPAVALLDKYGVKKFYDFLKDAGISTLFRSPEEYGLPLILGGAEATLWEVVSLYCGLGNYGSFSELYVNVADKKQSKQVNEGSIQKGRNKKWSKRLISEGSSYLVLDILKDLSRPGLETPWLQYASSRKIAWKTGTSYGNRDAWAVGVTPEWTIGVWTGNFDSSECNELTGIKTAAPLLFRIFDCLTKDGHTSWFKKTDGFKKVKVSAQTGYPLKKRLIKEAESVPDLIDVYIPVSAKPLRYSPYERAIYVNMSGTEEVCSLCWDRKDLKKIVRAVYPPQIVTYLKERGNHVYLLPPHNKSCPGVNGRNPIQFIYPRDGSIIYIPRGLQGEYQKVTIRAAHNNKSSRLFWYLDDSYIGETHETHQLAVEFDSGWHRVSIVDQTGFHREIKFYAQKRDDNR